MRKTYGMYIIHLLFRQQFVKRQKIVHTYGREEEDWLDENEALAEVQKRIRANSNRQSVALREVAPPEGAIVNIGEETSTPVQNKCKCGSTFHKRTSHKDCPLRKKK